MSLENCEAVGKDRLLAQLEQYIEALDQVKGYDWPASRLTRGDMRDLDRLRKKTRKPITLLIREAVNLLCSLDESELAELGLSCNGETHSRYVQVISESTVRRQLESTLEDEPHEQSPVSLDTGQPGRGCHQQE